MEAAAVQGNKPRRRAGRDRCGLWVRTGRVGTAGARTSVRLTLGRCVCRRCARVRVQVRLHPSGVCRWRLLWQTRRRHAVSVWCGRACRPRRVHAGRARRKETPGVCHRRRKSSAFVAKEEDGVHVQLGGGRRSGHDDDDGSCNNTGDGNGCQD
ncbi:hypothetical protein VPH35_123685 [Triticum aestivum]